MDLQIKDKVAVVTGASRGIGKAIAEELAREGMKVVLVARSEDLLEQVASSLQTEPLVIPIDLMIPTAAEVVVKKTIERFGKIDLLVNNAGATKRGDFLELNDQDWSEGFALKFFGAMRLSREAWNHLKSADGSIVFISGIGGRTGSAEFTIGGSVNAALLNLTKSLADRGTTDGVRVNAVNPSAIKTDRLQKRIERQARESGQDQEQTAQLFCRKLGVCRFGKPDEIASMVAFLASPRAGYIHGSIIDIDGGKTLTL